MNGERRQHPAAPERRRTVGGSPREGRSAAGPLQRDRSTRPGPNAGLLQAVIQRWDRGDYEPRPDELHPDIEIVSHISGRALQGYAGLRHWIADLDTSFAHWHASLDEIHAITESRLVAVARLRLQGRETGLELDQPCALIVDFRGDRIARIEAFPSRVEDVLARHGMSSSASTAQVRRPSDSEHVRLSSGHERRGSEVHTGDHPS